MNADDSAWGQAAKGGYSPWGGGIGQSYGNGSYNALQEAALGPLMSFLQGGGNVQPWFPGYGQGGTFFGQMAPNQVGTNQFAWGLPPATPQQITGTQGDAGAFAPNLGNQAAYNAYSAANSSLQGTLQNGLLSPRGQRSEAQQNALGNFNQQSIDFTQKLLGGAFPQGWTPTYDQYGGINNLPNVGGLQSYGIVPSA